MAKNDYYDYYAVTESAVDVDVRRDSFNIEHVDKKDSLINFLRFRACIMTVGSRNRNKRLWLKNHINPMMEAPHIQELFAAGGLPGENGHPIPPTGQVSMDRLVTIDTNNLAILIKEWWWEGDKMMGIVETLDQGDGTPGNRMAKNMIQGMIPSFSVRTLVPQRINADGTIDVTAPGRFVCADRVIGPSCSGAYQDSSIPVKSIAKASEFENAMESFTTNISERSEAVKRVLDGMNGFQAAMESATLSSEGLYTFKNEVSGDRVFIPVERNLRREIADFMMG